MPALTHQPSQDRKRRRLVDAEHEVALAHPGATAKAADDHEPHQILNRATIGP